MVIVAHPAPRLQAREESGGGKLSANQHRQLACLCCRGILNPTAVDGPVAELAYAWNLKFQAARRVGSNPTGATPSWPFCEGRRNSSAPRVACVVATAARQLPPAASSAGLLGPVLDVMQASAGARSPAWHPLDLSQGEISMVPCLAPAGFPLALLFRLL